MIAHTDAQMVPCGICTTPTRMLGTKRCDGCWELEQRLEYHATRLLANPASAPQMRALLVKVATGLMFDVWEAGYVQAVTDAKAGVLPSNRVNPYTGEGAPL